HAGEKVKVVLADGRHEEGTVEDVMDDRVRLIRANGAVGAVRRYRESDGGAPLVAAREKAGMDIKEVLEAMQQVEREKGIPFNSLLEGLQQALAAAYKRTMPEDKGARVEVDPVSGDIHVFQHDLDEEG